MAKTRKSPQTRKKLGGPRVEPGGPRESKARAVEELKSRLGSGTVILTEYRGLTVRDLAELRAALREAGTEYRVFKNRLATIAAREVGLDELVEHLSGPTAFAFAQADPVVAAKRLSEFARRVPALVLKAGVLDGRILSSEQVGELGALDSREVMLAKAAGMLLSPIQKLANLFAAPLNQLGGLLAQLREKTVDTQAAPESLAEAEAPAPAERPGDAAAEAPAAEAPAAEAPAAETQAAEAPAPEEPEQDQGTTER